MDVFIKLTDEIDQEIRINTKYIQTIQPKGDGSWVSIDGWKQSLTTKQSPDQIEKLIYDGHYNDDW